MKRKESSTATPLSRKRAKRSPASSPPVPQSIDSEREYRLRSILEERKNQYLIDWEDDEVTGEKFQPTWEPKRNANREAIDDWNRRKAGVTSVKKRSKDASPGHSRSSSASSLTSPTPRGSAAVPTKRRSRLRRVIQSSSQPDDSETAQGSPIDSEESGLEILETQSTPSSKRAKKSSQFLSTSSPSTSSQPAHVTGVIHLPEPPSSYEAGVYEAYSLRSSGAVQPSGFSQESHSQSESSGSLDNKTATGLQNGSSRWIQPPSSLPNPASNREIPDSASAKKSLSYPASSSLKSPSAKKRAAKISPRASQTQERLSVATNTSTNSNHIAKRHPEPANTQEEDTLQVDSLDSVGQRVSSGSQSQTSSRGRVVVAGSEETQRSGTGDARQLQQSTGSQSQLDGSTESSTKSGEESSQQSLAAYTQENAPLDLITPEVPPSVSVTDESQVSQPAPTEPPRIPTQESQSSFPFATQVPYSSGPGRSKIKRNHLQSQSHSDPLFTARSQLNSSGQRQAPNSQHRSSPIPSVPSHSIAVTHIGESAPSHPWLPSSPINMTEGELFEASTASASSKQAAEQGRIVATGAVATEQSEPCPAVPPRVLVEERPASPMTAAALLAAHERRARSPSAVPAKEALPEITQDDQNTSEAVKTLVPQADEDETESSVENQYLTRSNDSTQVPDDERHDPGDVYVVPIILVGHQRDLYPQTLQYHSKFIKRFLDSDAIDDEMLAEAEEIIRLLKSITLHPDLRNQETLTQYDVDPAQQAQWDVDCSAKFRFLKAFLDALRNTKLHVVMVISPGRITDILSTFLQGIDVAYRWSGVENPTSIGVGSEATVEVTLLSSADMTTDAGPADVVIDLDGSSSPSNGVISSISGQDGKWTPYLTLVVPRSAEHIERSISPDLSGTMRIRTMLKNIQSQKNVGTRSEKQAKPRETAEAIARFILAGDRSAERPIPSLKSLKTLAGAKATNSSGAAVEVRNSSSAPEKRSRPFGDENEKGLQSTKKLRVHSPNEAEARDQQEAEITHISDSVENSSQMAQLEQRFKELLGNAQSRVDEHEQAISELQFRFEDQRTQLFEVSRERDTAIATAQQAVVRFTEQANQLSTLRAERTALRQQLEEANSKLVEHSVPERAEFERLRLETAQAQADKEKMSLKLAELEKQLQYVRDLYQTSSNSAQSSASQVIDLEAEIKDLKRKASGEQAKARQISAGNLTMSLQNENLKLKRRLGDAEKGLKSRDEEIQRLKEAGRGRIGTGATSGTRSPRVRSRQGSPAAGELRGRDRTLHPLRNV